MTVRQYVHVLRPFCLCMARAGTLKLYLCQTSYPPTPTHTLPASVAQLDARQIGDREVAGSTPAGSATFFRGDLITKYFLRLFSPSADSRRAVVSFWRKNMQLTA